MSPMQKLVSKISELHLEYFYANEAAGHTDPRVLTNRQDYQVGKAISDALSEFGGTERRAAVMTEFEITYPDFQARKFRGCLAHSNTHTTRLSQVADAFREDEIDDDIGSWIYTESAMYGREFGLFFLEQTKQGMLKREGMELIAQYRDAIEAAPLASGEAIDLQNKSVEAQAMLNRADQRVERTQLAKEKAQVAAVAADTAHFSALRSQELAKKQLADILVEAAELASQPSVEARVLAVLKAKVKAAMVKPTLQTMSA